MNENELAKIIVNKIYEIHSTIGPGLLESVYEIILYNELQSLGLQVERQKPISIIYKDYRFDEGFRADLVVENKIILELKSVEEIAPVHFKQLLTYLKLTDIKLGLLVNFNTALIKDGIKRVVNKLPE